MKVASKEEILKEDIQLLLSVLDEVDVVSIYGELSCPLTYSECIQEDRIEAGYPAFTLNGEEFFDDNIKSIIWGPYNINVTAVTENNENARDWDIRLYKRVGVDLELKKGAS